MGGGLLELVAHGVQDSYMIGNPQITFFKIVFKRHTNFSLESVQATHEGTADFGKKVVVTLPRNGDLINTIILEADLPAITTDSDAEGKEGTINYVNGLGHALIDYVELEIGGQLIDKHYGEWMEIWTQLSYDESKQNAYDTILPRSNIDTTVQNTVAENKATTVYIPLQFWFCRNIGLALPLIALQYHDVKLNIKFKELSKLVTFGNQFFTFIQDGTTLTQSGTKTFDDDDITKTVVYEDGTTATVSARGSGTVLTVSSSKTITTAQEMYLKPTNTVDSASIVDFRVFIDYIFLDVYERKKFAQMKHRYLIEQVQFNDGININADSSTKTVELSFNLPIKSIYWVSQLNNYSQNNDNFNFSDKLNRSNGSLSDPITKAVLQLNGTDRFEERNAKYFRLIQPFQKHTRVSKLYIYMYSFCLKPEAHQPTGTCNFSKINSSNLNLTYKANIPASTVRVYALNYNILRIFSGMGGLAFSN